MREAEPGNLMECERCGRVIRDAYGDWHVLDYYDFDGEIICDDCMIDYMSEFRVRV